MIKIKFITAAYSYEVDTFLNREVEKVIYEDITAVRKLVGTPALFISSNREVLIAVSYNEERLSSIDTLNRITNLFNACGEELIKEFANHKDIIKSLQKKGYNIKWED